MAAFGRPCPADVLKITIDDPARDSGHVSGAKTARFLICGGCGIVPVVTSRIGDRLYAVVNVNAFGGIDPVFLRRAAASFDGESESDRLASPGVGATGSRT